MRAAGQLVSLTVAAVLALPAARAQGAREIPLDTGWTLAGEGTRIDTLRGERAIVMQTGSAVRRDVSFENGEIEFDVALTAYRSFVYVKFRVQSDDELEEIYFRPHKTNLPDAVQYDPVWNGDTNWQLYHGDGGTVATPLSHSGWMHVRIVVEGKRAALFLDRATTPQMVMMLARNPAPGYVAFSSFSPQGAGLPGMPPAGAAAAAFRNLVVRPGPSSYSFAAVVTPAAVPGLVTRWQVSPPFEVSRGIVSTLPATLMDGRKQWSTYDVEPTGVLVIGRHVRRPAAQAAVVSRLVIPSATDGLRRLRLGYSDYVTVFVNGRPVFGGDAHYSFDAPRQDGVIGLYQATLWLPLRKGDNEVLFIVADGFGGWGLMGQLDAATVRAP